MDGQLQSQLFYESSIILSGVRLCHSFPIRDNLEPLGFVYNEL